MANLASHRAKLVGAGATLKSAVVDGAAANTNIAVSGLKLRDALVSVVEFASGVPTDRTATTAITSAGNIQCTVDTTGDKLVVLYQQVP